MKARSSIGEFLDMALPLVQAPMAGVQDHRLAVAVCNGGGLGSLPCATLDPAGLERELQALASKTSQPFNVNFFCHDVSQPDVAREQAWLEVLSSYYGELGIDAGSVEFAPGRVPFAHDAADVLERYRPAVVSFHFGLPEDGLLARVRALGSRIFSTATTVEEARWLEARGVDAIVVQGSEAGGHRGMFLTDDLASQAPTLDLLRASAAAVSVPLIAAGGIADASDVRRALDAGACAVQCGTAFLLASEATTSAIHRAAIADSANAGTDITNVFTGRPARGIVNRLMREIGAMRSDVPAFPRATAALAPLRAAAERSGRGDFTNLWAGEKVGLCRVLPAAQITAELAEGAGVAVRR